MIQALHVAQSGLYSSKVSVENVMNNVANENTPGYKKRVANLTELAHSDARVYGRGVTVESVTRVTNTYMYDNLIQEESKESYLKELSSMLGDIESTFYETDESGFSNDLDRYFQAVENLRSNPQNQIYKNNLEEQSKILVQTLQTLYSGIESKEAAAKSSVYDKVDIINGILEDIGKVNEQIGQRLVQPNDLLDKRDALEQELAQYIDIEVDRTDDYQLKIGGQVAVRYSTNIHNVQVVDGTTYQKDYFDASSLSGMAAGDTLTYYLDNGLSETVSFNTDVSTTISNLLTQMNANTSMSGLITPYKGQEIGSDGKTLVSLTATNDLVIYSKVSGTEGAFSGRFVFNDISANTKTEIPKDKKSKDAVNDLHIEIFDQELTLKSGNSRAMVENLDSESANNLFKKYKKSLDDIAAALSDITAGYISNGNSGYDAKGLNEASLYTGTGTYESIKLFTGATVKTLSFNQSAMTNLSQADLDYLATTQWNENIDFASGDTTSFTKYFQTLQVEIAADKENVDFRYETQAAVKESLKSTYEKLVKVDKDEEMINLIQFQAAYEASAKIVTVVDEMLQTILGMKR